jgi:hypothetical protein
MKESHRKDLASHPDPGYTGLAQGRSVADDQDKTAGHDHVLRGKCGELSGSRSAKAPKTRQRRRKAKG